MGFPARGVLGNSVTSPPLPARHWFLSAVCAAGATDTFQFLKQKIHDKNLNIWEAAVALPLAFHSVMPNKKTLEVASVSTNYSPSSYPATHFGGEFTQL